MIRVFLLGFLVASSWAVGAVGTAEAGQGDRIVETAYATAPATHPVVDRWTTFPVPDPPAASNRFVWTIAAGEDVVHVTLADASGQPVRFKVQTWSLSGGTTFPAGGHGCGSLGWDFPAGTEAMLVEIDPHDVGDWGADVMDPDYQCDGVSPATVGVASGRFV